VATSDHGAEPSNNLDASPWPDPVTCWHDAGYRRRRDANICSTPEPRCSRKRMCQPWSAAAAGSTACHRTRGYI